MTHDELLAEIKSLNDSCSISSRLGNALKAVVEIHTTGDKDDISSYVTYEHGFREEIKVPGCIGCGFNGEYAIWDEPYPCPTIQAIEKELK